MNPFPRWLVLASLLNGFFGLASSGRCQAALQSPFRGGLAGKGGSLNAHRDCAGCHTGHKGVLGPVPVKGSKGFASIPDQICMGCHEAGASGAKAEGAAKLPAWTGQGSGHVNSRFNAPQPGRYTRTVKVGNRTVKLTLDCSGCHDSHGKGLGRLRATAFDGRGQLLDRAPLTQAEVCFGCHAGREAATLRTGNPDVGSFFALGVGSSHAIGSTADLRPDLPSLRTSPFRSRLDCGSCHGNPDPTGARGPHVSANPSLLKAPFGREKDMAWLGERVNELCFLCHDRLSITSNQSFPMHAQHLSGFTGGSKPKAGRMPEGGALTGIRSVRDLMPGRGAAYMAGYGEPAACATCHASHGSFQQAALIEFDRSVVMPSSAGGPSFLRSGMGHGTCTLTCHGKDHVQTPY